jgi:CheY-like chemotaxis protein
MVQPLALLFFERVMPGSQLQTRLEALGYRVHITSSVEDIFPLAKSLKPLIIFADLITKKKDVCPVFSRIHQDPETQHIPIIAITDSSDPGLEATAREAGANIVVSESAIAMHLKPLRALALAVE